ncbi:hypothetical protein N9N67_06240 [Bacteriovoracaceae bacterium]|nr:hypothetical protein [Bacteriovoracaceae bacterium]
MAIFILFNQSLFAEAYSVKCKFVKTDPDSTKSKEWFNLRKLKKNIKQQRNRAVTFKVKLIDDEIYNSSDKNILTTRGLKRRLTDKGKTWITALNNKFVPFSGSTDNCYASTSYNQEDGQSLVEYCYDDSIIQSEYETKNSRVPNLRIHFYPFLKLEDQYGGRKAVGVSPTDVLTIHYNCYSE